MFKIFLLIVLFTGLCLQPLFAQSDSQVDNMVEQIAGQQPEEQDLSIITENLSSLADHPIALNSAEKEELKQSGLFTDFQVESLIKHLSEYGKLLAPQELQQIEGFDLATIHRFLPYIKTGDIDQPNASL